MMQAQEIQRQRRKASHNQTRAVTAVQGIQHLDINTGYNQINERKNQIMASPNTAGMRYRLDSQPQTPVMVRVLPSSSIKKERNRTNTKNYERNMQMLNEIRKKLPIQDIRRETQSPFETENAQDRDAMRRQVIMMNAQQYDLSLDAGHVVDTIHQRSLAASHGQQFSGRQRRRNIDHFQRTRQPQNLQEPSICELYSQQGIIKQDFWNTARNSNSNEDRSIAISNVDDTALTAHPQYQNMTLQEQPELNRSAFEKYDHYRRPESMAMTSQRRTPQNVKMSTLPVNQGMQMPSPRKFKLSSYSKARQLETDEMTVRLYDRTKQIQNRLKQEQLRVLTTLQKELYQNYSMFEKPPLSGSPTASMRNSSIHSQQDNKIEKQVTQISDPKNILLEDTNKDYASDRGFVGNTFMTMSHDHDRDSIDIGTAREVGTPRSQERHERLKSMQFATGNELLLLAHDSLKQLLNERMENYPQLDANEQMRESNFLMRTLISSVKANGQIEDKVSHAMSLIWKYVVVNVDQILQSNQNKYKHLIKKFEANVENAVKEKMERFERDRLTFENQRIEYKKEIADLQRQLAGKDRERKKLIEIIQNHEHKYESLRDPTGLQQFKRLISSFTVGLDSILAEKEQQYTAMKSVVRMMDDMGEYRYGENMKQQQAAQKQQQKLNVMEQEVERLQNQLEIKRDGGKRTTKEEREVAKARRQDVMDRYLEKRGLYEKLNQMDIPEDARKIAEGALSEDQLKALRILFAEQYADAFGVEIKKEFNLFYHKEVLKAQEMQMTLVRKKMMEGGDLSLRAEEKFIGTLSDYFMSVTKDGRNRMGTRRRTRVGSQELEYLGEDAYDSDDEYGSEGGRGRRTSIYSIQSDEVVEYDANGKVIKRTRKDGTVIGADGKILVYGTDEANRGRRGGKRRTSIYSQESDEEIIYDANGKIVKRIRKDGTVIDGNGKILVYGKKEKQRGRGGGRRTSIYSQESDEEIVYDANGKILKRIRKDGTVIDANGKILVYGSKEKKRGGGGRRTSIYSQESDEEIVYDANGKILKRIRKDGTVIDGNGKILVYGKKEKMRGRGGGGGRRTSIHSVESDEEIVRDANGKIIKRIRKDGTVIDGNGKILVFGSKEKRRGRGGGGRRTSIHSVESDEEIIRDANGKIIKRIRKDGTVIDGNGKILVYGSKEKKRGGGGGRRTSIYSQESDEEIIRDANGKIIKRIRKDGTVIDGNGKILVYGSKEKQRGGGRRTSIYSQESDEEIVYDANGKILKRIRKDGTVIDANGKILVYGSKEKMRGGHQRRTSINSQESDEEIVYDENGKILKRIRKDGTVIDANGKILVYGSKERERLYSPGYLQRGGGGSGGRTHSARRRRGGDDRSGSPDRGGIDFTAAGSAKIDMHNKLMQLDGIKSRINTGLANADGSKNSRIVKNAVDLMKNPIIAAIKKTLKLTSKKNKQLQKDFKIAMVPTKIMEIMDQVMQEKVWVDIEQESSDIVSRQAVPFHTFMYDMMIMKFGLQSIAIKTLIQLVNGLNFEMKANPYAHTMSNMIGMASPPYRLDEIQIVLRSHMFFKMVQENWITKTKKNHDFLKIDRDDESNLHRGGNCSIFEILDELKIAFKDDKELQERILTSIKPDNILKRTPNRQTLELRFLVLKITTKLSRLGKNPAWVYNQLDADKSGTLDPDEIIVGLKSVIGVIFSKDETRELSNYMDEDKSGDIDEHEFCQKISLDNMYQEAHDYQISELTFIEKVLGEWYHFKKREQKQVLEMIKKFDENQDGQMQLSEYEAMINEIEPGTDKKTVLKLFKEALAMQDDADDLDAIEPEILMRQILQYKIGGFGKEFFSTYLSKRKAKHLDKKGGKKK